MLTFAVGSHLGSPSERQLKIFA